MPYTNDFKDMTDVDETMKLRGQREVLHAAVVRQIFCQATGVVLDERDAVLVIPSQGPMAIMTAEVFDASHERIAEATEDAGITFEVYDGREIFT